MCGFGLEREDECEGRGVVRLLLLPTTLRGVEDTVREASEEEEEEEGKALAFASPTELPDAVGVALFVV